MVGAMSVTPLQESPDRPVGSTAGAEPNVEPRGALGLRNALMISVLLWGVAVAALAVLL